MLLITILISRYHHCEQNMKKKSLKTNLREQRCSVCSIKPFCQTALSLVENTVLIKPQEKAHVEISSPLDPKNHHNNFLSGSSML